MTSNIEPLARAICERDLRRAGTPEINLAANVDRYLALRRGAN